MLHLWCQQRTERIGETDYVGVVPFKTQLVALADKFDDIDCAYLGCVGVELVKIWDDLLFVRDSYIESAKIGVVLDYILEIGDLGNLKIDITGSDTLGIKLDRKSVV